MIRINRGAEVSPGIYLYHIPAWFLGGRSRQPLLDACRKLKLHGASPGEIAGVFREGREEADISCPVWAGAKLTVSEPDKGRVGFVLYREFAGIA